MLELHFGDNWIVTRSDPEVSDSLSRIDGSVAQGGYVFLPPTRDTFLAIEAIASPTSVTDEYISARVRWVRPPQANIDWVKNALAQYGWSAPMADHQWEFLAFAAPLSCVFNASEQGTGKTRCTLALILIWQVYRTLIVCPKSVCDEWAMEAERCGVRIPVYVFNTNALKNRIEGMCQVCNTVGSVILVTNYHCFVELTRSNADIDPSLVVFDESWIVKNHTAAVTKAALRYTETKRVILMSGTPYGNHAGDIHPQLALTKVPVPKHSDFVKQHVTFVAAKAERGMMRGKAVGARDPVGLARLSAPVWFRATKRNCLDLPPKIYRKINLTQAPLQRAWYDEIVKRGVSALGETLSLAGERVEMMRLHQVCGGHVSLVDSHTATEDEDVIRLFLENERTLYSLPCPKIEWLQDFANDRLTGDRTVRAIVWCQYNAEVQRVSQSLHHMGLNVAPVYGDMQIDHIKRSFQSRSEDGVQVIVAQIRKMAFGHNLQAADHLIYYSNSWSYIHRAQSEDRADRQGRIGSVSIWDLLFRDSIDTGVYGSLKRKTNFAERMSMATTWRTDEHDQEAA